MTTCLLNGLVGVLGWIDSIGRRRPIELSSASHQWNINFLKAAHDWKMDFLSFLFTLLYSIRVREGGEDRLCWILFKRGLFDVRYKILL
jgi:hypothetical protein